MGAKGRHCRSPFCVYELGQKNRSQAAYKLRLVFVLRFYSVDLKICKDFIFKTPKARAHGLKPSL